MNKVLVLLISIGGMMSCSIQNSKKSYSVPNGYKEVDRVQGDLNNDGVDDCVVIVKGTEEEKFVVNRFGKEVDRNRRGILVYLTRADRYYLAIKNLKCFSSENEDGGGCFPPVLSLKIKNEKLYIHYDYGKYGAWSYIFRCQKSDLELVAYNLSVENGPVVIREMSIDFLTKKKEVRENVNQDSEENNEEVFVSKREDFVIQKLHLLSEIADFDELNFK
ncbi:MAG: hypothetical protein N4A35_01900 [Flavobacteriales bacterium]|jgi:hypothetical protein|nr:hypothetical protein [Flavobacteriales bacterium]